MEVSTPILTSKNDINWNLVKRQTVKIQDHRKQTIGTGFFISNDGLLITCAHVVNAAGGHHNLIITGKKPDIACPPDPSIDIAFLKIPDSTTESVPLGSEYHLNGDFLSFGYGRPLDFPNGGTIHGQITDCNSTSYSGNIQMLRLSGLVDAERVEGGASGSPVYDIKSQKVIGIICAHDRNEGALALPFSELSKPFEIIRARLNPHYLRGQQKLQELHNLILREHLGVLYQDIEHVEQHTFEEYLSFFKLITNGGSYELSTFRDIESVVSASSPVETIFWIKGAPGSGKSSFLSLVYWILYRAFQANRNILPIYLNLHRYSRMSQKQVITKKASGINRGCKDLIPDELERHLQPLQEYLTINPEQQLLIIIDGYDDYSSIEKEVFRRVTETYLQDRQCMFIVGSKNEYNNLSGDIFLQEPNKVLVFNPIKRDNPELLYKVVESFLKIALPNNYPEKVELLMDVIDKYKLEDIDLFTLSLLKCRTSRGCTSLPSFSSLIQAYCSMYLSNINHLTGNLNTRHAMSRSAQLAFALELEGGGSAFTEDEVLLDLIYTHPRVKDYLIAKCVVTYLNQIPGDRTDKNISEVVQILQRVQPSRINSYCKEIINQDDRSIRSYLTAIEELLFSDLADENTKSFLCYILGRIDIKWRDKSYSLLERFKQSLDCYNKTPRYHFLLRTVYISLIMLGSEKHKDEYIEKLLNDRTIDQVNRGFHLEYYEDQPIVDSKDLSNKDNLGDFSKTYKKLKKDLQKTCLENQLFEIQLHTICSLAQHRHAAKKLSEDNRLDIVKTINYVLDQQDISNPSLKKYVRMIARHLNDQSFTAWDLLKNLYKIKIAKRQGWLIRGIKNGESVADHTFGAYLIALLLLPEKWSDDEKYSKQSIIDMLLIHDLAEAITHDIPSIMKGVEDDQNEQEVFEEIELLGTYNTSDHQGINFKRIVELYREFNQMATFNARIAREIDALENWTQLQIYKAEGHHISEYTQWSRDLKDKIQTPIGISMLRRLTIMYSNLPEIGKVYREYRLMDERLIDQSLDLP